MEMQPTHPPDDDPRGPEAERLERGEIDLTGATRQEDDLKSFVNDAIVEAEAADGRMPEWGARGLARALANRLNNPLSGALHHFAVTGRADPEAMVGELTGICRDTTDEETLAWVQCLGHYVTSLPEEAPPEERSHQQPAKRQPPGEIPVQGSPLEKVTAYLRIRFAEADARGEAISNEDAQDLATLFASLLGNPGSELERFAETGDANPATLLEESEQLKNRRWKSGADIRDWVERFQQHLASRTDLGRREKPSTGIALSDNPQVAEGLREHGDAFRAFLRLPDTETQDGDLLARFQDAYVGTYASTDALFEATTEIPGCKAEVDAVAEDWGFDNLFVVDQERLAVIATAMWDIVKLDGKLHVFSK